MDLMCKHVYHNMHANTDDVYVQMSIRLWKCLNLLTLVLGGEGLMVFMGNEFGHPEWVEFPSDRNGQSFDRCRRRWYLSDDKGLFFYGLNEFTRGLMTFLKDHPEVNQANAEVILLNGNKVKIAKGNYIVAANLATDYFDGSGLGKALFTTDPDGEWKSRGMWAGVFERESHNSNQPQI